VSDPSPTVAVRVKPGASRTRVGGRYDDLSPDLAGRLTALRDGTDQ
jgi:hypothetical protein